MTTPSIEEQMDRLEGSYEQINFRLGRLEGEIISLRSEITALRSEMNALRPEVNARLNRMFFSTLALMGGVMASVVATILTRLL
jgi:predicted  nucleic acid-binding Zn-ribbon protein